MFWPFSTPSEILLDLDADDEIIQTNEISQDKNVFSILTKTTIYFLSLKPTSLNILAKFKRNAKSIENYGENSSVVSDDENVFIIKTGLNCLMIFMVNNNKNSKNSNDDLLEVLNVFNDEKETLLQDVYLTNDSYNVHYYDIQFKFKVVLKLGNHLLGYSQFKSEKFLNSLNVLVILIKKNDDLIFQFLNLNDFSTIQSLFLDECPWFTSKNDNIDIIYYNYNQQLRLFSFITSDGNCWIFRFNDGLTLMNKGDNMDSHKEKTPENQQSLFFNWSNTTGYCVYNKANAVKIEFNNDFKIFIVLTKDNSLEYYSFKHYLKSNSIMFLKKFKNPLNSKKVASFKIFNLKNPNVSNFEVVIFNNGWCIVSNFGNVNFSTFDYDSALGGIHSYNSDNDDDKLMNKTIDQLNRRTPDNWFNQIKDISYIHSTQKLVLLTKDKVYVVDLIFFPSKYQIDSKFKMPIFIHESNLVISNIESDFSHSRSARSLKINNKNLNGSSLSPSTPQSAPNMSKSLSFSDKLMNNTSTNKATDNKNVLKNDELFYNFQIPFDIMRELGGIELVALSGSHKNLLCLGNKQLYYHNFKLNKWFAFDDAYYDELLDTCQILFWDNDFAFLNHKNLETGNFEILTFNLNKVTKTKGFNTSSLIWKYELDHNVVYMNLDNLNDELILVTSNWGLIIFKLSYTFNEFNKKQVLINVVIKTNLSNLKLLDINGNEDKIDNKMFGNFNLIRVNSYNNDLLLLVNGDLYLLKIFDSNHDKKYMKFFLFHNIEYFNKLSQDNLIYCFDGDKILFFILDITLEEYSNGLLDFKIQMDKTIKELQILEIENFNDDQFYPIQMVLDNDYYLEGLTPSLNEISQTLKLKRVKKFILHEFLSFEIMNAEEASLSNIYSKYKNVLNFDYSNELLLYQTVIENEELLPKLLKFILLNPNHLSIIAQCLRKIEIEYWSRIFQVLKLQPVELFHKCLNSKDYKTAGYYLIIFLSFIDIENEKDSQAHHHKSKKKNKGKNKLKDIKNDNQNKKEIFNFLKLILDCNFNSDSELLEMLIELIRFLKVLDEGILLEALNIIEK